MNAHDPESDYRSLCDEAGQSYFTFKPRKDQPDRFDEQRGFVRDQSKGVTFLIGGNGAGTTECAMHKLARFVMSTPPPRRDTPFWIIGNSYEQVMDVCWKEKLSDVGHGHIPRAEIDWPRITWYKPNLYWPFKVPLRDWPGRPNRNWQLEFKSYEQGRMQLQAKSIGGFCFTEQFPWELLTEVLRGCREYNFEGSKFAEFTPVDPMLSLELEDLIDRNRLPPGWKIYRANTAVAAEAGHVQKSWYDEFFGMVPEEQRATRETGEFASYEGTIYRGFNRAVHAVGDDVIDPDTANVFHRRVIDWGAGPENAFVCLWAYRNSLGQWFVYDEYWSTDQDKIVNDHLEEIRDRWFWPRNSAYHGLTWADPASEDCIRIAIRMGFNCVSAANAVYEGIDCVRYHLKNMPIINKPRLFIHRDRCPNLVREMRTYRWRKGSTTGDNPVDARPEPLKRDDHAVDALRYLLFSEMQFSGGKPGSMKRAGFDPRNYGVQMSDERPNGLPRHRRKLA